MPRTVPTARVRTTTVEAAKKLAEEHGRNQSDVIEAALRLALAQPQAFKLALMNTERLRPPDGTGRRFRKPKPDTMT